MHVLAPPRPGRGGPSSRAGRPVVPRVVQALGGLAAVVALVLGVVLAPVAPLAPSAQAIVGEVEQVALTGPTGTTVLAFARLDTGGDEGRIDAALARSLGLGVRVFGPVLSADGPRQVALDLRIAGQSRRSLLLVADVKGDSPVVLGRGDLDGLQVAVGERLLSTPGGAAAPSVLDVLATDTPLLSPRALLALLPLAALLIVVLRVLVGLKTLGTFSPVLLALGHAQAGLVVGVGLTVAMLAAGLMAQPLLRRARLPRVARLAVLIGVVSALLLALQQFGGAERVASSWGATLPIVVTAVIIERLWEAWDLDGPLDAVREAAVTLAVSIAVAVLLMAPSLRYLAEAAPATLALSAALLAALAGSYRGLRVSEVLRFRAAADEVVA